MFVAIALYRFVYHDAFGRILGPIYRPLVEGPQLSTFMRIEEVQEQEKQEQFAATLFQWDLVIRFFRRVEKTHMLDREPTQQDLQYHKAFLNALLSVGEFLAISAEKFSNEDLKPFRIRKEDLLAYLRELEHSYSEWHGELSDARRQDLSQKIFGGAS